MSGDWLRGRVDYIYHRLIDCTSVVRSIFLEGAFYFWDGACYFGGRGMDFEIFHINFQNWDVAHKSW